MQYFFVNDNYRDSSSSSSSSSSTATASNAHKTTNDYSYFATTENNRKNKEEEEDTQFQYYIVPSLYNGRRFSSTSVGERRDVDESRSSSSSRGEYVNEVTIKVWGGGGGGCDGGKASLRY